jgi:hypothetical protein
MAYDGESDRIIFSYGGETWAYDYDNNTWVNMTSSSRPSVRFYYDLAYDSRSDRIILYSSSYIFGDIDTRTWAYDYNTNTWTNMSSSRGPGYSDYALVYNSRNDRVILFGGCHDTGGRISLSDWTYTYDYYSNTWTNMNTSLRPPPTTLPGLAYDSQSDRVILFGGRGHWSGNETWAYELDSGVTPYEPATDSSWVIVTISILLVAAVALFLLIVLFKRKKKGQRKQNDR